VIGPDNGQPLFAGRVNGCIRDNDSPCTTAGANGLDAAGNGTTQLSSLRASPWCAPLTTSP